MCTRVFRGMIVALIIMPTVVSSATTVGVDTPKDCTLVEECVAFDTSLLQTEYKHVSMHGAGIPSRKIAGNTSLSHDATLTARVEANASSTDVSTFVRKGDANALSRGLLSTNAHNNALEKKTQELPEIIFQYGGPRTATTLQFEALCGIMFILHSEEPDNISCSFAGSEEGDIKDVSDMREALKDPSIKYRVIKLHSIKLLKNFLQLMDGRQVWTFTTAVNDTAGLQEDPTDWQATAQATRDRLGVDVKYVQVTKLLSDRGYTIIRDYRHIFGLDEPQMNNITEYIRYWDVVRQCCGCQMSKDWRAVLQGASVSSICQIYDLDGVESALMKTSLYQLLARHGQPHVYWRQNLNFTGTACTWFNRQVQCQNLQFNENPQEPFC